jgi:ABC-type transport system substrate-binding protein
MKCARSRASVLSMLIFAAILIVPDRGRAEPPSGQMTWAVHFSLAPTFFDPGETPGLITPFLVLYALHDALVKPMPGKPQAGSLAESWSVSPDGLVYEFVLRLIKANQEKKLKNLYRGGSAAFGNAATRIEALVLTDGMYAYGGYPDIDGLFREQASEPDRKKREAILHKIQQLMHERAIFAPLFEPAFLNGYGSRVAESGLGLINYHGYSAPYEDVKLKAR